MKTPQPVAYVTGQPRALRWAWVSLFLLVTGVSLWWTLQVWQNPAGQIWRVVVVLCSVLLAGWGLRQHLRRDLCGTLRFDGERWWFQAQAKGQAFSEQPVWLHLVWDAQTLVLVRLHWDWPPEQGKAPAPQTLWLQGDVLSHNWTALRRALIATARIIPSHAITV